MTTTATGWTGYTPTVLAAAFTPAGRHRKAPVLPSSLAAPVAVMNQYDPDAHSARINREIRERTFGGVPFDGIARKG